MHLSEDERSAIEIGTVKPMSVNWVPSFHNRRLKLIERCPATFVYG